MVTLPVKKARNILNPIHAHSRIVGVKDQIMDENLLSDPPIDHNGEEVSGEEVLASHGVVGGDADSISLIKDMESFRRQYKD